MELGCFKSVICIEVWGTYLFFKCTYFILQLILCSIIPIHTMMEIIVDSVYVVFRSGICYYFLFVVSVKCTISITILYYCSTLICICGFVQFIEIMSYLYTNYYMFIPNIYILMFYISSVLPISIPYIIYINITKNLPITGKVIFLCQLYIFACFDGHWNSYMVFSALY